MKFLLNHKKDCYLYKDNYEINIEEYNVTGLTTEEMKNSNFIIKNTRKSLKITIPPLKYKT